MRLLLLTALLAALAAGSASAGGTPVRDCSTRAESGRAPLTFTGAGLVVVGPVGLTGLASAAKRLTERDANGLYRVKSALLLRAGHAVVLSIPERHRGRIALTYAQTQEPAPAVRFVACAAATKAFSYRGRVGSVTAFPGGFELTRPGCYPLDVAIDRAAPRRVRIPFGYPCR